MRGGKGETPLFFVAGGKGEVADTVGVTSPSFYTMR